MALHEAPAETQHHVEHSPSAHGSTSSLRATCGLACRDVASCRDTCNSRSSCDATAPATDLPQAQPGALPLQRPFALLLAQSGVTRSLLQPQMFDFIIGIVSDNFGRL